MTGSLTVLTVGHSTHPYEKFLRLVQDGGITAIGDVRSAPFSRHHPHFNADALRANLQREGIVYVLLGKELGGRPTNDLCYTDGVADYEKLAVTKTYQNGVDRIVEGARSYRLALMCSEQDPLDCHRCLLIGRTLHSQKISVQHLLPDGKTISQREVEERLLGIFDSSKIDDLFASRMERIAVAYRRQARKVAFAEAKPEAIDTTSQEKTTWSKQVFRQ